jgi:hypothetical protein
MGPGVDIWSLDELVSLFKMFEHAYAASGDLPATVRARGGHLVAGHHAHRDGGRGAALLQRAAAAGDAPHPRHAAAQAQEPEGVAAAAGLPLQDARPGSGPGRSYCNIYADPNIGLCVVFSLLETSLY